MTRKQIKVTKILDVVLRGTEAWAVGFILDFQSEPCRSILTLFLVNILIEDLFAICHKPSAIYVSGVFQHAAPLFARLLQLLEDRFKDLDNKLSVRFGRGY